MEEGDMKSCVAVLVAVALFWAPCADAKVKAQKLELKAGDVALTVKDHDGKSLAKAEVKLQGAKDKLLSTVKTDKEGKATLKGLKPGAYKLVVADRAVVKFTVSDKAKVATLLVVLPRSERLPE